MLEGRGVEREPLVGAGSGLDPDSKIARHMHKKVSDASPFKLHHLFCENMACIANLHFNIITYYPKTYKYCFLFLVNRHYPIGGDPFENLPARTVVSASLSSNSSRTAPNLPSISRD